MNYAWCFMILISFICAFANGTIPQTTQALIDGAKESVFVLLSFAGVMCFWTGILKIGEDCGILRLAQRLFKPIIKRLFKNADEKACEYMTANLTANLLGMGNAATPMGIKAMQCLDKHNTTPHKLSHDMALFVIFNTTSITLFPTTVIALRASVGAAAPYDVILPIWIASVTAAFTGVLLVKIFFRKLRI